MTNTHQPEFELTDPTDHFINDSQLLDFIDEHVLQLSKFPLLNSETQYVVILQSQAPISDTSIRGVLTKAKAAIECVKDQQQLGI